jgi:hypothetical protein
LPKASPFYISALIRSNYPDKDLTTIDGLNRTLEYEILPFEVIKPPLEVTSPPFEVITAPQEVTSPPF